MKTAMSITLPQAPRRSLVDSTIDAIRTQVEGGAWNVGEKIPAEQELADMLRVGRNTVREAIRVLSHAHVLEVRQGDGTYVRSNVDAAEVMRRVGRSSLREHFELRAMLEAEAARLAAHHRSEADVALLRGLLRRRGEKRDHELREAFVDADIEFHGAIARISGNAALAELYRYFSSAVRFYMLSALEERDLPMPGMDPHETVVDAIDRRDAQAAAAAARALSAPLIEALETSDGSVK
jgi:DNA-binding FadR family transcriptional regulator